MRPTISRILLALGLAGAVCEAQNCPIHGPAYPPAIDVAAPPLVAAKAKFDEAIAAHPDIDKDKVWFAIEVYSSRSKEAGSIHRHYNHAPGQNRSLVVGPDTLFRIHSISKVVTVYTMLTKIAFEYWNEPVTKFIPELADHEVQDATRDVDWNEVTVGTLASQISGISRDYGFTDASTRFAEIPGLRTLNESEIVRCGSPPLGPCSRADALRHVLRTYPLAKSYRTPNYSNMAFQLLAYAVENITGIAFPDLVVQQLIEPLELHRTYVTNPGNDSNAVIYDGWDMDLGDENPMGGYYSCMNDLTAIGRSILNSTLLTPFNTRKWLRPGSHVSSPYFSMGSPWEIMRQRVAVSSTPASERNRIVDVYSKQGGGAEYTSILAVVPDFDMGLSILTGGPVSGKSFLAIRQLFMDIWLPAAEQAAREQALTNFVGTYTLSAPAEGGDSDGDAGPPSTASMEITLLPDEPAICMTTLVSDNIDIMALLRENTHQLDGFEGEMRMWFYPIGLVEGDGGEGTKIAFRGVAGLEGKLPIEDCGSWAEGDRIRWGNYPSDVLIFELDANGKAKSVTLPALGKPMLRAAE